MLDTKYGKEVHSCRSREAQGPFGVGFWKEILKEADSIIENYKSEQAHAPKLNFPLIIGVTLQL